MSGIGDFFRWVDRGVQNKSMQDRYGPDWRHQRALQEEQRLRVQAQEARAAASDVRQARHEEIGQTASLAGIVANALEGQQAPTNYEGVMPPDFDPTALGLEPSPEAPPPVDVAKLAAAFGLPAEQTDLGVAAGTGLARQSKRQMAALLAERQAASAGARAAAGMDRTRFVQGAQDARLGRSIEARHADLQMRLAQTGSIHRESMAQADDHFQQNQTRMERQGYDADTARQWAARERDREAAQMTARRAVATGKMSPEDGQEMEDEAENLYQLRSQALPARPTPAAPTRIPVAERRQTPAPAGGTMVKYQGRVVPLSSLPTELQAMVRASQGR